MICKGGTANKTTVSSTGAANQGMNANKNRGLHVYDGATVNCTTVGANGSMFISGGGVASQTTISGLNGCVRVSDGGKAFETAVTRNGALVVEKGGEIDTASVGDFAQTKAPCAPFLSALRPHFNASS